MTESDVKFLTERTSIPKLIAPAPSASHIEIMFQAAFRACDHGYLRPWRFLTIQGNALNKLGKLFLASSLKANPTLLENQQQKLLELTLRAPMIVVAIFSPKDNAKIPEHEQLLAMGGAAQNFVNAAHVLQYGAIWRTGDMAINEDVKRALKLAQQESIAGFIYLGTPDAPPKNIPEVKSCYFVEQWE